MRTLKESLSMSLNESNALTLLGRFFDSTRSFDWHNPEDCVDFICAWQTYCKNNFLDDEMKTSWLLTTKRKYDNAVDKNIAREVKLCADFNADCKLYAYNVVSHTNTLMDDDRMMAEFLSQFK